MIKSKYLIYSTGNPAYSSHIDAVHAASPSSDQYTGEIVLSVIKLIDASGIIATVSREEMDINRPRSQENAPAIDEFRAAIRAILDSKEIVDEQGQLNRHYLHLAIHGMTDDHKADFIVGTRFGVSCSPDVEAWFLNELVKLSKALKVNRIFPGDSSKPYHRHGDPDSGYAGYGERFHTIQIEISRKWRKNGQKQLANFFKTIITQFDRQFNPKYKI